MVHHIADRPTSQAWPADATTAARKCRLHRKRHVPMQELIRDAYPEPLSFQPLGRFTHTHSHIITSPPPTISDSQLLRHDRNCPAPRPDNRSIAGPCLEPSRTQVTRPTAGARRPAPPHASRTAVHLVFGQRAVCARCRIDHAAVPVSDRSVGLARSSPASRAPPGRQQARRQVACAYADKVAESVV
jgi:hypothetical protein